MHGSNVRKEKNDLLLTGARPLDASQDASQDAFKFAILGVDDSEFGTSMVGKAELATSPSVVN
jgi:hypothetical protein